MSNSKLNGYFLVNLVISENVQKGPASDVEYKPGFDA